MNTLVIEKQTGGYFKFTLNGDTANAITSIQNDLLAVGTQLHFKTGNGANIIKEQFIYPADLTIISGGTFTFTTVAQVWNKLIEIGYFAWLGGGGTGGVDRFDELLDTFSYTGKAGKVVVVDNSELKLVPVTFYNKRLFTELEDTPSSLVPNKMVVVNEAGTSLILQDQPAQPEQLLNSVGYFDYNDLITQTFPLSAVANTPLKLTNDTNGANTSTSENPYGVSYVWDNTSNAFNFSELSVGDTIDIRIHIHVTTTTSNQKVILSSKLGIGSASEFTNSIYENQFKSSGLHEVSVVAPFYMGSNDIIDSPAELYLTTDASASVKVEGWYIRILRKNINIITVDYTVPDATNLVKGIVRLGGDLAGTADSPTVPGLTTKVPTTRTIGTTSPLLGGGALSSNLTLSIQQGGSTQNGYLSSTDWIHFDDAYNNKINSVGVTGTTTKTLTLTQQDGGTLTTSWTDDNTGIWGTITGTLSSQTDLQNALNAKVAGSGTSGQIAFWNGTSSITGESNLFWDSTNDRLGIGTATPTLQFQVGIRGGMDSTGIFYWGSTLTGNNRGFLSWDTDRAIISSGTTSTSLDLAIAQSTALKIFPTRNVTIQSSGTFTDNGFRLDVNGTQAFRGTASCDTPPLGAELLTTGTGDASWTGTDFATGYTHVAGSVTTLTSTLAAVVSTFYQITYTITGRTAGSFSIDFGGVTRSGLTATGKYGPLATSTGSLVITPTTDFDGTIVLYIKTIGTSASTTSFFNSTGVLSNEIRVSNINSNTFIGIGSGRRNTTGNSNAFFGNQSGISNTTGSTNAFFGINSGYTNTLGDSNSFFGTYSGQSNTTGSNNTAVGRSSLFANTVGGNNTAIGQNSLTANITGSGNTAIGKDSLQANTIGNANTSFGQLSLANNTSGSNNVALGFNSGRYAGAGTTAMTAVSNSIYLGASTRGLNATGSTNEIVIGYDVVGLGSNTTSIGNSSTTATAIYGDLLLGSQTDNGTDKLQVTGTVKVSSSVQVGDNATAASATNVGAIRYRSDANNSYMDMVMQTGLSVYQWINVVQNTW